jgi:hypothetical protein
MLRKALANLADLSLEEGVRHGASNHKPVNLFNHIFQH